MTEIPTDADMDTDTSMGRDWVVDVLFPLICLCWAFLNALLYIAGLLEFELAVVYILLMIAILGFCNAVGDPT